jgi:hypothetical protein
MHRVVKWHSQINPLPQLIPIQDAPLYVVDPGATLS